MRKLPLTLIRITFFALLAISFSCQEDDGPQGPIGGSEDPAEEFALYFDEGSNSVADPGFISNTIIPTNDLGSTCNVGDSFIEETNYKGAIDPNAGNAWYSGWSAYEAILAGNNTPGYDKGIPTMITDADMQNAGDVINWTNDKLYIIQGLVFVNEGQTLNIQAGTVIQGTAGEAENASALIVARGAKIMAEGTDTQPIIFSFDQDSGGTAADQRGRWGGLIILGSASLNSQPGETAIEGIPTNESRGLYGGSNDSDNSGVLRYVSCRHGGTNIGADNEINGITFGGVGSGTTIEYVEVISNKDDGFEWFGGTAQGKYLISAFCGDDGLDYDEGYRGKNQFVIVHQDPTAESADRGGEHDGGTDPEDATPYANPIFSNVTSIGNPGEKAITFRDNAAGQYYNSIFTGYEKGIDIEDLLGTTADSYQQFVDGNLKLECNVFFEIGAGDTGAELFIISN